MLQKRRHIVCARGLHWIPRQDSVRRIDEQGLTVKTGQTHVAKYHHMLLKKIESGEIDPAFVITHRLPLDQAPQAYKNFRDKKDSTIKVVLKP